MTAKNDDVDIKGQEASGSSENIATDHS